MTTYDTYTVRTGDSLRKISYCLGVSTMTLCALNHLAHDTVILHAGQKLRIPTTIDRHITAHIAHN